MKFVILTLALAALTGSQAFVLRDNEPDSKLAKLTQEWEESARNISRTAENKLTLFKRSELGRELQHLTEQGFSTVARPFSDLERKLPTEVTETAELVFGVPGKVVEKVITGLHDLQRYGRPTVEDFYKELQSALAVYVDPVLERVGPYTETLRLTLVARIQKPDPKLDEKLLQQLESLRIQLHPNIKKLEDFQTSLKPYVDEAQKLFRKGVETVHKHLLQPYIAPIMQMSQKYKGEFKKWAATPLFPPNP